MFHFSSFIYLAKFVEVVPQKGYGPNLEYLDEIY